MVRFWFKKKNLLLFSRNMVIFLPSVPPGGCDPEKVPFISPLTVESNLTHQMQCFTCPCRKQLFNNIDKGEDPSKKKK